MRSWVQANRRKTPNSAVTQVATINSVVTSSEIGVAVPCSNMGSSPRVADHPAITAGAEMSERSLETDFAASLRAGGCFSRIHREYCANAWRKRRRNIGKIL